MSFGFSMQEELVFQSPPVLYLIFNRPDLLEQSFVPIRNARPSLLFIAADGPRADREGEADLCLEARRIVEKVDWPCEVKTLFRDENLGCRKAVSEAITWFYEHVEEGIILEDDCVADASFFPFCAELLERYRDDIRVLSINGTNWQQGRRRGLASYYFSRYPTSWGWATWRDRWQWHEMSNLNLAELSTALRFAGFCTLERSKIERSVVSAEMIDSWAYSWSGFVFAHRGLCVVPQVNVVKNIGHGCSATHTRADEVKVITPIRQIEYPLIHPHIVKRDAAADRMTARVRRGVHHTRIGLFLREKYCLLLAYLSFGNKSKVR